MDKNYSDRQQFTVGFGISGETKILYLYRYPYPYPTNALPQLHLQHHCRLGQPSHLAFIQSKHVEERKEDWYLGGENSRYLMLGVTTPQDSVSCFWFVVLLRMGENGSASSLLSFTLSCLAVLLSCSLQACICCFCLICRRWVEVLLSSSSS